MTKQLFVGFLLDAGWVEVIVGVAAIILTVFLYRLTKKKKSVSYEVLSETPLVSISDEIKGKLRMLFNEKPVEKVHLLLIKFINDGNVPVAADDYERPLTLRLEGTSDVLSAEFVDSTPANLNPSLNIYDKVITFDPTLMNAGDSFTAKVLVGEYGGKFDVDARVLGVKFVREVSKNDRRTRITNMMMYGGIGVSVVALVVALGTSVFKPPQPQIVNIKGSKPNIFPDHVIRISSSVVPADEEIKYEWLVKRGRIADIGLKGEVDYQAPNTPGPDSIRLQVIDKYGRTDSEDWNFEVEVPTPMPTPTQSEAASSDTSPEALKKRAARMHHIRALEERLRRLRKQDEDEDEDVLELRRNTLRRPKKRK